MSKVDYEIRKLQKRVTNGGIGRREFIKAATAMGFAATAPALFSHAAHATPKKGGVYRVGFGGANTGDMLDPADNGDTYMINMNMGGCRNALVEVGSQTIVVETRVLLSRRGRDMINLVAHFFKRHASGRSFDDF